MPVWHDLTRDVVADGDLVLVGIVQEQHPDRTALFQQWRGFDFPILWDPFGFAGLDVVPVLTGIDEHGVVRVVRPNPRAFESFMAEFVEQEFEAPLDDATGPPAFRVSEAARIEPSTAGEPVAVGRRSAARLLLGGPSSPTIDADVAALEALAAVSGAPTDRFRAGVARRMRYDGPSARAEDFQVAVDAWRGALAARPDQYIWRRRIQQWGPRLDKPYAFYDWVETARREVATRGETPVEVLVPLSGSEVADGSRAVPTSDADVDAPDPTGGITRDAGVHVRVETAVARHTADAGSRPRTPRGSCRVHVTLRPRGTARWEPEADPAQLWVELPDGWSATTRLAKFPRPVPGREAAPLTVDFGASTALVPLGPPKEGPPPPAEAILRAYAVYSVCLEDGTCVFRRQDLEIVVPLPPPGGRGEEDGGEGGDDR
ncbi:MAG: hypothetical protein AAGB93_16345 [Planctomycetota bacterium]